MTKKCTKCKLEQPLENFGSHARMKDGLQSRCKPCIRDDSVLRKGGGQILALRAENHANPGTQRCGKCKIRKPFEFFNRCKSRPSGFDSYCKECHSSYRVAHYRDNPAPEREKAAVWRKNNLDLKAFDLASYRSRKLKAVPAWADEERMKKVYAAAATLTKWTGETWHVDHVIPLRGKNVCGLHCETNLQLLTATENQSKGNR